jgi:hypothetical protein
MKKRYILRVLRIQSKNLIQEFFFFKSLIIFSNPYQSFNLKHKLSILFWIQCLELDFIYTIRTRIWTDTLEMQSHDLHVSQVLSQ